MDKSARQHKTLAEMTKVDLNRMAVFVRVVDAGSFTVAARALGLPPSSVSRAISHLERDLGVRLLQRTTRQLSLTDAGLHLHERVQPLVREAEQATELVTSLAAGPRGVVRITAPVGFAAPHFSNIIAALLGLFPELVIDLRVTNRKVDLVAEGVDLAIRAGVFHDSSLVMRKISAGDLGIFAAPSYLKRRGRPRTADDLARHDCLSYRGMPEGKVSWRLAGPRGTVTVVVAGPLVCDDMSFLRDAVCSGLGMALLPIHEAVADAMNGRLVHVLPQYRFAASGVCVVWPSRKLVPARVVKVREFLIEQLTRLYSP